MGEVSHCGISGAKSTKNRHENSNMEMLLMSFNEIHSVWIPKKSVLKNKSQFYPEIMIDLKISFLSFTKGVLNEEEQMVHQFIIFCVGNPQTPKSCQGHNVVSFHSLKEIKDFLYFWLMLLQLFFEKETFQTIIFLCAFDPNIDSNF